MRILVLVCLLVATSTAQTPGKEKAAPWMYGRIFAASDKPVLARAIGSDSTGKAAFRTLLNYCTDMEANMNRFRATAGDYKPLAQDNIPRFLDFYGLPRMNLSQRVYLPVLLLSPESPLRKQLTVGDKLLKEELSEFEATERTIFNSIEALSNTVDSAAATKDVKSLIANRKGFVRQWQHVMHRNRENYTTDSG